MVSFACKQQKEHVISKLKNENKVETTTKKLNTHYAFGNTSIVKGCANVILQKISADLQYELRVDLEIDEILQNKELKISKDTTVIKIYLNKYPKGNSYIKGVCDDKIYGTSKTPQRYIAISGILKVNYYHGSLISLSVKDLMLRSSTNQILFIPIENFEKVIVNWFGG
ncbi:MAG: hypothetical protein EAY69_07605 [Cytophagales bacterium]|nr:MAG: hypothetical protein EAY69_07605 [Cytophagales bacterium]